jgi:hypothetical protein
MSKVDAHIWIAVYAAALPDHSPEHAITMADFSVKALQEKDPETYRALDAALNQTIPPQCLR